MGVVETAKRQLIASTLAHRVAQFSEGVLLGAAADTSDIDIAIIAKPGSPVSIVRALAFREHPSNRSLGLMEQYGLGRVSASDLIDGVPVNCYIYHAQKIADYVTLKKPLSVWRPDNPPGAAPAYGFDGKDLRLNSDVTELWGGFIYNIPPLINNKFYATAIREQFLGTGTILHDADDYLASLENDAWRATIRQLTLEHSINADLDKYNVLNTLSAYHQKKLPPERVAAITKRTVKELNTYVTEL
jgi:hypothetical protein